MSAYDSSDSEIGFDLLQEYTNNYHHNRNHETHNYNVHRVDIPNDNVTAANTNNAKDNNAKNDNDAKNDNNANNDANMTNQISYITIATTGNATDFGDTLSGSSRSGATSADHGGLA